MDLEKGTDKGIEIMLYFFLPPWGGQQQSEKKKTIRSKETNRSIEPHFKIMQAINENV